MVCSYKTNERQWGSDDTENPPPHLPKSAQDGVKTLISPKNIIP